MRIIYISFYYFYETIAYKNIGSSKERPNGYKPVPIIFMLLLIKDLSSPSNGMYIYEPNITYLSAILLKKGLVIFYNSPIIP